MKTVSENASFHGTQGVYTHTSTACNCDMTFGLFLPRRPNKGPYRCCGSCLASLAPMKTR